MSDSDEMLMATRSRRSNAGNKMQKLLEQERVEMQERTSALDDDEINLLFQEDDDDEEFMIDKRRKRDEDEEFSESDDESDDEEDEDAGERELERQEKKRRKLAQKKKVPVIKKRAPEEIQSKPQYEQPSAESLLLNTRRTSKRSSVVANKLQVYEKLAQAEKKRKEIQERIRKHKEKQADVEITQEDRLREAEETERINLLSLNKFKEQEIYKKHTRMALHQRKKMSFKPGEMIVRVVTTDWLISPSMEIEDREFWEQQLAKRHKKKKKYTKRKKNKSDGEEQDSRTSQNEKPGSSSQSPNTLLGKDASSEKNDAPLCEPEAATFPDVSNLGNEAEDKTIVPSTDVPEEKLGNLAEEKTNQKEIIPHNATEIQSTTTVSKDTLSLKNEIEDVATTEINFNESSAEKQAAEPYIVASVESTTVVEAPQDIQKQVSFAIKDDIVLIDTTVPPSSLSPPREFSAEADNTKSETEETPEAEELIDQITSDIYEGPQQLVGRNFVTLYSYPNETPMVHDVRTYLFGLQWSQPLNARSQDVEMIAKITNDGNATNWTDLGNSPLIPDYDVLDKFPAFGEFDKTLSTEVVEETNKQLDLDIKTEAPTGVFFPNGIRKKCLITNRDCQYFDPKNGVPYADVEAYKTIQDLQDPVGDEGTAESPKPKYKWFGFARGGIFLDVQQRAAKGAPEGF